MPVEKGKFYSWPELLKQLNAEKSEPVDALHRQGKFLGFALNRWQNPKAPDEILIGYRENRERYAEAFIRERPVVPVFIRESEQEHEWCCAGFFQIYGHTNELSEKSKRVLPPFIPAIYKILFLEESHTILHSI